MANREARGPRLLGEKALYAVFAAFCTLWVALQFYAYMRLQTTLTAQDPMRPPGEWSAPLDDVFIHFDYARATARGYPFQWSEGNGFSSGNTSLLYPFILAFGYWIGFRQLRLMVWAALVACVCTFALLLASRRLFRDLPRPTTYLIPPALLGVGVMSWSLFSGMEVAFFLALSAAAFVAWDDLLRGPPEGQRTTRLTGAALVLGFWNAALVATRPEAALIVAVLALSAAAQIHGERGLRSALRVLLAAAVPGALVVLGHSLLNRVLTGESTAAGALVKLELHHPHLSGQQVFDAWWFHVKYQFMRVFDYHMASQRPVGFLPIPFALLSLAYRSTRRYGAVLLTSAVLWTLIVALNGQVRWQNERYTMPALCWVMLAALLGAGALVTTAVAYGKRGRRLRVAAVAVTALSIGVFAWFQRPKFRDQVWFFGRASRNIRDQHIRAARIMRAGVRPPPTRVLVGDAGAMPYVADIPALDLIGLGGFKRMPFARATRQGVGAALELIERMPAQERPDLLALYPSWWGTLPLWFGEVIYEVPVSGNVICGGAVKVLYRPHWERFADSGVPFTLKPGEAVQQSLDVADLVSEDEHEYRLAGAIGFVDMKLLPNPAKPQSDLWDAGRVTPQGARHEFRLAPNAAGSARLVLRLAPGRVATLGVRVDGGAETRVDVAAQDGWVETSVPLPAGGRDVVVEAVRGEHVLCHAFVVQGR